MDTTPSPLMSRPPPVGRDRELAVARDLLCAAVDGRGSLLLIGGNSGVGKTALAQALAREATELSAQVYLGHCYDRAETPPYGPWLECLAQGSTSGEHGSPPDPAAAPTQEVFFTRTREYLAALAAECPTVLVLEDVHWADAASLHLLRSLTRTPSLAPLPLLIVATYRNDEVHRGHPLAEIIPLLVREAPVERIDLRPLDQAAADQLVRRRYDLSEPTAARLAAYLMQRTEGNPLFMTELLRTLEEERVLAYQDGAWNLGTVSHVPVPALLRQVIEARAIRLGEEPYELLAVAAVIGQEVPLAVWQEVGGVGEDALVDLAERSEAAQLVVAWPGGDGIRFAHALIRDALYEGVHPMRRRRLHLRAGEVLAAASVSVADAVAYHFQQAGDERAIGWLVRAAERAADSSAPMDATERYAAAFALLDARQGDAGERAWLRLLAASQRHYQDPQPANHWVEEAVQLAEEAGDPRLAARALAMRGLLRGYRGEVRDGIADLATAASAIDALPPATEPEHRREAAIDRIANRGTQVAFLAYAGRLAEARAEGEHLLATRTTSNIPGGVGAVADIHSGLSIAYALLGEPDLASHSYAANVAAYQTMGHGVLAVMNQREELVCVVLPYRVDDLALRERATVAVESASRQLTGAGTYGSMDPRYARLPLLIVEGKWREARHIADNGAWSFYQPSHHLNFIVGPFLRAQGEREGAWELIREAWPSGPVEEPGDRFVPFTVPLLWLGAALALDDGDLSEARAWLDAYGRWLDWMGAALGRSEGQALEAEWWRASGDVRRAREHAELALQHATDPRQPLALLAAHRLLGTIEAESGHRPKAEEHFSAALTLASACRAPYERALILLARAEMLAAGDANAAVTLLDEVQSIAEPLDARPLLSRANELATQLGDRGDASPAPLSDTIPLPWGLSARETEVLRLVAEGLTNRQIADRLFLSPRTVSSHLVSIFGKLGVTTRAAATRATIEHGLR